MIDIICEIYKSPKKDNTYLYLQKPADLDLIPEKLSNTLGQLEFVMELVLTTQKKLARENVVTVMENIKEQGFHLQIPPKLESLLSVHKQ